MGRFLGTIVLVAACACGSQDVDPVEDKLDDPSTEVIDVTAGESLTDVVVDRGKVVAFRIDVRAGDTIAAVMRAQTAGLDPYLLVKNPSGDTIRKRDDQALLPMAPATDAAVVWTAANDGPYFVFAAGGADLTTPGAFRIDVIGLEQTPAVQIDILGPAERAIHKELARHEPEVADFIAAGAVQEGTDGLLVRVDEGFKDLPLADRARLNQVVGSVNSERDDLFRFVPATLSFAELWRSIRELAAN